MFLIALKLIGVNITAESLRLHPATRLTLARKVPKGGATISGEFFLEGVRFHT